MTTTPTQLTQQDASVSFKKECTAPRPSPATPTAAPTPWAVSPGSLLQKSQCPCSRTEQPAHTGQEALVAQLQRLQKVWRRLTASRSVPRQLQAAGVRVLLALRSMGLEEFHWIARNHSLAPTVKRHQYSILLLVASPDAPSGHRWVAEILVHQYASGKRVGEIETVATRQSEDWEDWSCVIEHTYYRLSSDVPLHFDIPEDDSVTGAQVIEEVWAAVAEMLGGDVPSTQKAFRRMVSRVTAELGAGGALLTAFEVAMRARKSTGGRSMVPCIIVTVYTSPSVVEQQASGGGQTGSTDGSEENAADAVIMIDPQGVQGHTRPMAVSYQGDWPIVHHYRTRYPTPKPEDWESLVKKDKADRERPDHLRGQADPELTNLLEGAISRLALSSPK